MKKLFISLWLLCPAFALAQLFPNNPVPIRDGYGADGAGTHNAYPSGYPGVDCEVNPVSISTRVYTETVEHEVTTTAFKERDTISIPTNTLFDFDVKELREDGVIVINDLADLLEEEQVIAITVEGHTDSKGTVEYNNALGYGRALAFSDQLTIAGYDGLTNVASGGELSPIAPNENADGTDNPEGRQKNRRVDVTIDQMQPVEVEEIKRWTEEVERFGPRNPQIFHVASSNHKVYCARGTYKFLWLTDPANLFN